MKLTIFFNGQFWEGVVEVLDGNFLNMGRHIFGAEPQDAEVLEFVCHQALNILKPISGDSYIDREQPKNPKRIARQVRKEMENRGISTKAQDAMREQQEQYKQESKRKSKDVKKAKQDEKWERSRQKAKEKHRGK